MDLRAGFARFAEDERGATAIEYGMIAAGIGGVVAATVYYLGDTVMTELWQKIAAATGKAAGN